MKLLVTAATGNLGTLVVEHLLKTVPADQVAVSVRDVQKAAHWSARGVDVRSGNYLDYESMEAALKGVDRLLLISSGDIHNRVEQHVNVIKAAKAAGVQFIAYTSAPNAAESKLAIAGDHRETERAIRESGIPYAFLRNNWYLENEMGTFQAVLNGAPWAVASGEGKVGWAPRRDYAEAAANVLAGTGHENKVYELAGKPITQAELAAIFASAMNREVQVAYLDEEAYGNMLASAGVPEQVVPFLLGMQRSIRDGELDVPSEDLSALLGRPVTPLDDAIRALLA